LLVPQAVQEELFFVKEDTSKYLSRTVNSQCDMLSYDGDLSGRNTFA